MLAFSSCGEQGLLLVLRGLLIVVASRCRAWALGSWASVVVARGLSSCGSQAQLWHTGFSCSEACGIFPRALVALRHVGSSRDRDRTRVPCIGRWILNHCATREVPEYIFLCKFSFNSIIVRYVQLS